MEENNKKYIGYKVQAGYNYKVKRNEYNGMVFYNISVAQKLPDDQVIYGKKQIRFKKGVDIPDGTIIKINRAIENFYKDKNGREVFYLQVNDYEIVQEAIQEYDAAIANASDDDLPF